MQEENEMQDMKKKVEVNAAKDLTCSLWPFKDKNIGKLPEEGDQNRAIGFP